MATGYVTFQNPTVSARVDEIKAAYGSIRRVMDALIEVKNSGGGNNWAAVAAAVGAADATAGQTVFDNLDAALGGMTTANNALSFMDENAL